MTAMTTVSELADRLDVSACTIRRMIQRGELAIGYAQGIAEDLLRQAGVASVLFDPAAPWRARPATDKQRAVLERLRVEVPDSLTAGEASDLISAAFARRTRPVGG
jgi:hypothetical protein